MPLPRYVVSLSYERAIRVAQDLIEPAALDLTEAATEYARGICEFLADVFPSLTDSEYLADRAQQVAKDIGLTETRDIYNFGKEKT